MYEKTDFTIRQTSKLILIYELLDSKIKGAIIIIIIIIIIIVLNDGFYKTWHFLVIVSAVPCGQKAKSTKSRHFGISFVISPNVLRLI